jgi:hypothetical protein
MPMNTTIKDDTTFRAIDRVLKQIFGENTNLFIYNYLEQRYSLQQRDFSKRSYVFAKGLEDCISSGVFAI